MDIKVEGGQVLAGTITPSGSKNSAVHILPSTILFDRPITLENIPDIKDVETILSVIKKLGGRVEWDRGTNKVTIDNKDISFQKLGEEDLGKIKASALLWGGLLGRFKKVDFGQLPGGCTLGIRPFEPFYKSFRDLNIKIEERENGVYMDAGEARAADLWLTEMSVSVTSALVMVATSLSGKTTIMGAASEPQVQDLCTFLNKGGAKISGIGSGHLTIEGGQSLNSTSHKILNDHCEISTFLALGAATGGEVFVEDSHPELFKQINYEFSKFNIEVSYDKNTAIVAPNQKIKFTGSFEKKTNVIRAQPWPGLPVDLLPIFIPLALAAPSGYMLFHNWMYESGLYWTSELVKLGGEVIMADPHRALVMGGKKLVGTTIEAPYIIRAVVALTMAGMLAKGQTTILNADALYRGHPNFSENLKKLGAKISEVPTG